MKIKLLIVIFLLATKISAYSQIIDTVYFDLEGEIIIKEVASIYRVAKFDTLTGGVLGEFKDFDYSSDSLLGKGSMKCNSDGKFYIENFAGDSSHFPIAVTMSNLKASFIRIKDYPKLKSVIKPRIPLLDRTVNYYDNPQTDSIEKIEFHVVEAMPQFPGGEETMAWFMSQFLRYPEEALKNNISGTVIVKFLVDSDGTLNDFSIVKSLGYGCDEEAIRVMKLIPDWLPGIQHGNPVSVYLVLPIRFE